MTNPNRPPVPWQNLCILTGAAYTVKVSKLPLRKPKYTIQVGAVRQDGTLSPFLPVPIEGQGSVQPYNFVTELQELLQGAHEAIAIDAQWQADAWVDDDIARAQQGKPVTRHTGKTERNRAKGKAKPKAVDS